MIPFCCRFNDAYRSSLIISKVNILLPPLVTLRTVCERLRTISPVITISANYRGEFRLKASSDDAKVETEWRGLKHPQPQEDDGECTYERSSRIMTG